jgi:adenylate cyclase
VGAIITLFAGATVALSFNWWVPTGMPDIAVVLAALASYTFRYVTEERQKNQLREQFEHYLDPNIIEDLAKNPGRLQLGGETKDLSILFSDIRGFTTISEQHHDDPERLVALINRYFDRLSNIILENGGTIDKYIGDCIMAFWNAPLDTEQHQLHACRAALAMQRAMIEVNKAEDAKATGAGHTPASDLKIGIGINSGSCVVGNIGSEKRFDYSVLGDAVNLASRLEGQTKRYGVDIIVGPDTADAVRNDLCVLDLDSLLVQGKNMAVTISTILDYQDLGKSDEIESQKSMHKKMLLLYGKQDWAAAINQIAECKGHFGGALDDYYGMLLQRIEVLREHPPGEDWDGVFTAETK